MRLMFRRIRQVYGEGEDNVWVGAASNVLPGAHAGHGTVMVAVL